MTTSWWNRLFATGMIRGLGGRLRFFPYDRKKENATAKPVSWSYSQFRRGSLSSMPAELNNAAADRADVARVRAGDVEAFASIVRRWQTPLINLAYGFSGDRGRAEEMAQEAFLRAYRGLMAGFFIAFAAYLVAWLDDRPSTRLTFQMTRPTPIQQCWPVSLLIEARTLRQKRPAARALLRHSCARRRRRSGCAHVCQRPRPVLRQRRLRGAAAW